MDYSTIIYEKKGKIAKITLNRPQALNAMSNVMMDELCQAVEEIAGDVEIDVMIITGAGRGFCAGRDLKEALRFDEVPTAKPMIMEKLRKLTIPTICAVNGHAVTGGLELAISCDIIIASEKAVFADTHARAGLVPGGGMSQILPRLVGPNRAKEISFTGRYISAQDACQIGLVNRVVPHDQLMEAAENMANDILGCHQKALRKGKALIEKGLTIGLEAGLEIESLERLRWREEQREQTSEEVDKVKERVIRKGRSQQNK